MKSGVAAMVDAARVIVQGGRTGRGPAPDRVRRGRGAREHRRRRARHAAGAPTAPWSPSRPISPIAIAHKGFEWVEIEDRRPRRPRQPPARRPRCDPADGPGAHRARRARPSSSSRAPPHPLLGHRVAPRLAHPRRTRAELLPGSLPPADGTAHDSRRAAGLRRREVPRHPGAPVGRRPGVQGREPRRSSRVRPTRSPPITRW